MLPDFIIRNLRYRLIAYAAPMVVLVGIGVLAVFWVLAQGLVQELGARAAYNQVLLDRSRAAEPLIREMALGQSLSQDPALLDWARSDDDPALRDPGLAALERFRGLFRDENFFFVHDHSKTFYFNNGGVSAPSDYALYTVSTEEEEDAWYFGTKDLGGVCHLNVDFDRALRTTKVWLNCNVRDPEDGTVLGVGGTGLELTAFIEDLQRGQTDGVTLIYTDLNGAIQAHPNLELIEQDALTTVSQPQSSIFDLVDSEADREVLRAAFEASVAAPDTATTVRVSIDGTAHLAGLSFIPRLNWMSVSVMDPRTLVLGNYYYTLAALLGATIIISLLALGVVVNRMVLQRVTALRRNVQAFEKDNRTTFQQSAEEIPDEIGDLDVSFYEMASTVSRNTRELEAKTRVIAMTAHDLRNPISAVHGMSEMMLKRQLPPEQQREFLDSIKDVSGQILGVLTDLLDVSAIESDTFDLDLETDNLGLLLAERVRLGEINAKAKGSVLSVEVSEVPDSRFDRRRMAQVMDNLLTNAIKFSAPNSRVETSLTHSYGIVSIQVRDEGQGIPADEIDRLFLPFQKLTPQATAGEQSTGLGLAIVKRIVDAHKGTIRVETEVGKGTTFIVDIPVASRD